VLQPEEAGRAKRGQARNETNQGADDELPDLPLMIFVEKSHSCFPALVRTRSIGQFAAPAFIVARELLRACPAFRRRALQALR
jgi:hypothetical protein